MTDACPRDSIALDWRDWIRIDVIVFIILILLVIGVGVRIIISSIKCGF